MHSDDIRIGSTAPAAQPASRAKSAAFGTVLLLAGSLFGFTASGFGSEDAIPTTPPPVVEQLADGTPASYASIVDRVSPAVVTIRSQRMVRMTNQQLPDHPFFREFFGERFDPRRMPERREGGMGSGVVVRPDGYILTNNHVVDGAEKVTIELTDGRTLEADVVGTDAPTDLAVLKVDAADLQPLALGDSEAVRVGDVVLAVGNPLGVGQTVTMGIVSAKGRATGGNGDGGYEDFIQTDAPINRGNSGGALVNTAGELIGINSQILSPSGGNIGIGFSIPVNMAQHVMSQLIDHGEVRRGRLGVTIQAITPDLARALNMSTTTGALVSDVENGSPAAAAGLKRGDVITGLNGDAVKDSNDLRNDIAQLQPGASVDLTVVRDGKEQTLTAKLAAVEASRRAASAGGDREGSARFGMAVEPLTADAARELGVSTRTGVVVASVDPGSRASQAGLRAGDVIEQVDRKPVDSIDGLRAALDSGDGPALLLVHRGATTIFVTIDRS